MYTSTNSPIAAEALARIAALYAIEVEIRGQPAAMRQAVRQEKSPLRRVHRRQAPMEPCGSAH